MAITRDFPLTQNQVVVSKVNGSQVPYTLTPSAVTTLSTSSEAAAVTSFSSTLGNGSCPSCGIGADGGGLVQFAWFPESIELTVDTVSVYVTIHNGTNDTAAVTSTSTIYGDLATVDVESLTEIESIIKYMRDSVYGGYSRGRVILARGNDGTLGSITSIPWPTPFIQISSVLYLSTTTYSNDYLFPSGLQYANKLGETSCVCGMTKAWPYGYEPEGLTSSSVGLPSVFYYPMDPTAFNWSKIENGDFHNK